MRKLLILLLLVQSVQTYGQQKAAMYPDYIRLKTETNRGWGQFNTQNILSFTHLPDGFDITLDLRTSAGNYSITTMGRVLDFLQTAPQPVLRPIASDLRNFYSEAELSWEGLSCRVQAAAVGPDMVLLVTPLTGQSDRNALILSEGILWNRPGQLLRSGDSLSAVFNTQTIHTFVTDSIRNDYNVDRQTPYLCLTLNKPQGISTGKRRTLEEIQQLIANRKVAYELQCQAYGQGMADTYRAISASNNFNTFYEPQKDRLITGGSRYWNVNRGGYAIFGWDPIFQSYINMLLNNKQMAYTNIIEGLNEVTPGGFVPNVSQGTGRKSLDRSQPPVGSLIVKELYKRYQEPWFLEAVFGQLLTWNRWWASNRLNGNLLSWGSPQAANPYHDLYLNTQRGASLESGMDDSPMYEPEAAHFNASTGFLELHDVGLNSLYIADCDALAEIADVLGRTAESKELKDRAGKFRKAIQTLWSEKDGIFLNRRTDNGQFSAVLSPTLFYPLISRVATVRQAKRMIAEHLENPKEFNITWMLPSVSANHPEYSKEAYWKGAVWSPLNFLVYWGMRNYDARPFRKKLAERSQQLLVKEWLRKGFVPENWSSVSGTADDPKLISTHFYGWGGLIGTMSFIELGILPAPEVKIQHAP